MKIALSCKHSNNYPLTPGLCECFLVYMLCLRTQISRNILKTHILICSQSHFMYQYVASTIKVEYDKIAIKLSEMQCENTEACVLLSHCGGFQL